MSTTKPISEEHKQKISEALIGRTLSQETRQRMSSSAMGKKKSPEHIRNLRITKAKARVIRLRRELAEAEAIANGDF